MEIVQKGSNNGAAVMRPHKTEDDLNEIPGKNCSTSSFQYFHTKIKAQILNWIFSLRLQICCHFVSTTGK